MTEVIRYEGEFGLLAILHALENVRQLLLDSDVPRQQVAGYLGCINLHLAQILGVRGEFRQHLQECGGLLCPKCKGFVGFVSNLSSHCHLCGAKLFPFVTDEPAPVREGESA